MATFTSNYAWTKPAGSDPVDIGVLNNNLDSQDGIMHDAFLNMADPFSESSTYAVGAIVLYGTKTYKCHTAVTTAGSWTGSTNWTAYKLAEGGLVAGDYVNIQDGVINVQTEIGTYDYVRYELESTGGGNIKLIVRKYVNNVLDSTTEYPNDGQHHEIDDVMDTWYEYGPYLWHYKLLVASTDHAVGYEESWSYQDTSVHTVNFQFAQDDSTTLVTKGDLDDALDDKVDKVTGKGLSTNDYDNTAKGIVDGVTANLALKADKTATASGETLALVPTSEGKALIHTAYGMSVQDGTPTPSTPVDIVSAKADLRSVGKNLIPYPYDYSSRPVLSGITYTINEDRSITMNGTSTARVNYWLYDHGKGFMNLNGGDYILSKTGRTNFSLIVAFYKGSTWVKQVTATTNDMTVSIDVNSNEYDNIGIAISFGNAGITVENVTVYPMLRLADVTDSTYEPYQKHDITTDLTLRAIEVTSSDAYNLVRDNKYYIADTLDYSEDNGFVVTRRVGEYEVLGTEGWNYVGDAGSKRVYIAQSSLGISAKSGATEQGYSSHFVYNGKTVSSITWGNYYFSGSNLVISANNSDITDITTAESWLSSNKPNFDYILVTPTTETITTAQALALLGLKTYDESTTISSQAEPACTVAVEYAKERLGALALTAYNTAKGNDLRITALES